MFKWTCDNPNDIAYIMQYNAHKKIDNTTSYIIKKLHNPNLHNDIQLSDQ